MNLLASQVTSSIGRVTTRFFEFNRPRRPLRLRVGVTLPRFTLAYETYGQLNDDRSNAILLFHAMTGSQHAAGFNPTIPGLDGRWTPDQHLGWWDAFIGPGKPLDTDRFCIICINYLGGCYGSTGPASLNPATGRLCGPDFPPIRMADIVDSQLLVLEHLGVGQLRAAVGASLGGVLCLSLATRHPEKVRALALIASGLETPVHQRVLNFEQITAIENDAHFNAGHYYNGPFPITGLELARRIAHKTFVSLEAMGNRARNEVPSRKPPHAWYEMHHPVEAYLWRQGEKFAQRFDANSYLRIVDAWQWLNLPREAGRRKQADLFSADHNHRYWVFSIDSDHCFPPAEQEKLVLLLERARVPVTWITVHSRRGHDAFLVEPQLFAPHLCQALAENDTPPRLRSSSSRRDSTVRSNQADLEP